MRLNDNKSIIYGILSDVFRIGEFSLSFDFESLCFCPVRDLVENARCKVRG
ncbi:hypothetical protein [Helicobacter sp. MIT 14-3879]|uniref:hypothetical protein n=1 Tax=Helicobacter sp. MIT 14-3879 TaxID=2040649 RepID=UPI0015F13866|nr:hypothetical protein [Helicobacter sp. MIT 14-3879]